jgi:hypothetical protein
VARQADTARDRPLATTARWWSPVFSHSGLMITAALAAEMRGGGTSGLAYGISMSPLPYHWVEGAPDAHKHEERRVSRPPLPGARDPPICR